MFNPSNPFVPLRGVTHLIGFWKPAHVFLCDILSLLLLWYLIHGVSIKTSSLASYCTCKSMTHHGLKSCCYQINNSLVKKQFQNYLGSFLHFSWTPQSGLKFTVLLWKASFPTCVCIPHTSQMFSFILLFQLSTNFFPWPSQGSLTPPFPFLPYFVSLKIPKTNLAALILG